MKNKFQFGIFLFVLALSANVSAQSLTLDSCRNMALRNNKAIQMAEESISGAGYERKSAFATYLPGIDFSATYMYNQHKIALLGEDAKLPTMTFDPKTQSYKYNILTNPQTGEPILNPATGSVIPTEVAVIPKEAMTYDIHNVVVGAITLVQPVYMGGQIRAMNKITKYAEQLATYMRDTKVQDVIYAVDEAYWTVISLNEKKRLAESYLELTDTLLFNVNSMLEEGVATQSDKLTIEVRQNEARIALTKVENGLTLARMSLCQLCGLPLNSNIELADEDLSDNEIDLTVSSSDINDVFTHRPDLQSLQTNIKIFEQKEKIVRSEMLPKLAVIGAYTFQNPNTINGFKNLFGGGFSIGASLSVPIWHWGGNYNKLKAARSETTIQRLQLEDAQEKVELQINQAKFRFREAFNTYDLTILNLDKATSNLRNAELGFNEGVLTINDVILAQTAWLQAHSEKIDAKINIQLCKVYLSKVLGTMNY